VFGECTIDADLADPNKPGRARLPPLKWCGEFAEQHAQSAARRVRRLAQSFRQPFHRCVNTKGRLQTEEEFNDIIVRATRPTPVRDPDPRLGRPSISARARIAAAVLLNNKEAVAIGIVQAPTPTRWLFPARSAARWKVI